MSKLERHIEGKVAWYKVAVLETIPKSHWDSDGIADRVYNLWQTKGSIARPGYMASDTAKVFSWSKVLKENFNELGILVKNVIGGKLI